MGADRQRSCRATSGGAFLLAGCPQLKLCLGELERSPLDPSAAQPRCSCCPPSLDTEGTSCTQRPVIHVGGAWKREFRNAIAETLRDSWPERANALSECGVGGVLLRCKGCASPHLVPFRCGARTCPTCARLAAAAVVQRLGDRIAVHDLIMDAQPWDGPGGAQKRSWRHVILTTKADRNVADRFEPRALARRVREARRALPGFWRSVPWGQQVRDNGARRKRSRRDTSYIAAVEVSPRGMVHVHMLVYGEYIAQRVLQAAWSRAMGEPAMVYVTGLKSAQGVTDAIREVLKYATKGEKDRRTQAAHAAAVELALRNVHRTSIGGALRTIRVTEKDGATEDVRNEDLHDHHTLACETCGTQGEWRWVSVVSAIVVEELGGFGALPFAGELPAGIG